MFGNPDLEKASTSYAERSNLTIRMGNRRFTRLTNAFSKKLVNHCHMLAVIFMAYNFCRKHSTLKQTPAMAAGVAEAKLSERFEAAFEARFTPKRQLPKSYAPTPKDKLPLPWYLDPDDNPPAGESESP